MGEGNSSGKPEVFSKRLDRLFKKFSGSHIVVILVATLISSVFVPFLVGIWKDWKGHDVDILFDDRDLPLEMEVDENKTFTIDIQSSETKGVSVTFDYYTAPDGIVNVIVDEEDRDIITLASGEPSKLIHLTIIGQSKGKVKIYFKLKDLKSKKWIVGEEGEERSIPVKVT